MQETIRNFCIISHIDHGKSTLADRFLEITATVPQDKMRAQFLDQMALEREKGITIKMQPVRMSYNLNLKAYTLNLIDTPGHVDFSYEVSRGLAAVEGAILLVDATKGIQAQTLHHLAEARKQGLPIIAAVNKIDLAQADVAKTKREIQQLLGREQKVWEISAKLGTNIEPLLQDVIEQVPPPQGSEAAPLRALIFDSQYDPYKGVVAFVRVVDGRVRQGEKISLLRKQLEGAAKEVGYFTPAFSSCEQLKAGEIGYIATGVKEPDQVRVGETITLSSFKSHLLPRSRGAQDRGTSFKITALPGYQEPKAVVFASVYPEEPNDLDRLQKALSQLRLTDPAFSFEPESKTALGQGFRGSFLGKLHAEIVIERLKREFGLSLVVSKPQVVYKMIAHGGRGQFIYSAKDFPEELAGRVVQERWVLLEIVTPQNFLGPVLRLLETVAGRHLETKILGEERLIVRYEMPLRELMTKDFYDQLKSISQGFASLNYELADWRRGALVKMEILIAGEREELFSQIVPQDKVFEEGRREVEKLKKALPRQQFRVALQAKVGGKIVARETVRAVRKDVIAPLYGGDYTRKRKLLEKQKKGKKKLEALGRVRISPEVFLKIIRG